MHTFIHVTNGEEDNSDKPFTSPSTQVGDWDRFRVKQRKNKIKRKPPTTTINHHRGHVHLQTGLKHFSRAPGRLRLRGGGI